MADDPSVATRDQRLFGHGRYYSSRTTVHAYLRQLTTPPPALTRGEKWLLGALSVVVAVSRRYALSKSPLDWDESLFAGGVREYNVLAEHPHAPGYPLFILFAKILRVVVRDDFHALQAVASIASLLLFPAAFFLLRELRFRYRVAIAGAIITVFLPTVWYYGGTALSDVPALCAAVVASALLLAGGRSPRAWILGMGVAGVVGGIRPAHLLIVVVPAALGMLASGAPHPAPLAPPSPRLRGEGLGVFVVIVVASYLGAALATEDPPWGYVHKIGQMVHHIGGTDSFQNVSRPPLPKLVPMFFAASHRGGRAGLALLLLAAIGIAEGTIRRRVNVGVVLAMFVPTAVASWMMLDTTAVTRYGIAYAMLYSVCGACGIDVLARAARNARVQQALAAAGTLLVVLPLINWTRPALALVRHQVSPPIAAMRWLRKNVPAAGPTLYLDDGLHFHAWYELAGYDTQFFGAVSDLPSEAFAAGNYCVVDWLTLQPHARVFRFPRTRLAQIAREIYFETAIVPMQSMVRFGDGWYQDEYDPPRTVAWRWMRESSTMLLPPLPANGILHLVFHVPADVMPRPPKLTIIWNGTVIDEHMCINLDYDRRYVLASRHGAPNECRIVLDETVQPKNDARRLALQLGDISWERVDGLPYGF
jgi:hypothetical protein